MQQVFSEAGDCASGDVAKLTGADPQWITRWADRGIIRPTPETVKTGRGKVRRFHLSEVLIAALLVPLAENGVPVGTLGEIADGFRAQMIARDGAGYTSELKRLTTAAIAGASGQPSVRPAWLSVAQYGDGWYFGPRDDLDAPAAERPLAQMIGGVQRDACTVVIDLNVTELWKPVAAASKALDGTD